MTILTNLSNLQAIIGTIGDIDSYQLPDAKGYTALMRHVLNVSDEERQQRRDEVLGVSLKDFRCVPQPVKVPFMISGSLACLQLKF